MKKYLKYILLIMLLVLEIFILTGCTTEVNSESQKRFEFVSDEGYFDIYYDKETKVMYSVSSYAYNYGNLTLLVDSEGKPLLYEGEN